MAFLSVPGRSAGRMAAWAVLLVALLSAPGVLGEGYELHLLIVSAIFVMLSSGLSLIVGHAGLLSLGHAAFFGLGAYTSALLYLRLGVPMSGGLPPPAPLTGAPPYPI